MRVNGKEEIVALIEKLKDRTRASTSMVIDDQGGM